MITSGQQPSGTHVFAFIKFNITGAGLIDNDIAVYFNFFEPTTRFDQLHGMM
jgi:hypothetical protein